MTVEKAGTTDSCGGQRGIETAVGDSRGHRPLGDVGMVVGGGGW
jgi:hypothetical protein